MKDSYLAATSSGGYSSVATLGGSDSTTTQNHSEVCSVEDAKEHNAKIRDGEGESKITPHYKTVIESISPSGMPELKSKLEGTQRLENSLLFS